VRRDGEPVFVRALAMGKRARIRSIEPLRDAELRQALSPRRRSNSVSCSDTSRSRQERYLGCKQTLRIAVNDRMGIELEDV